MGTILVVDDDSVSRMVICGLLARAGHEVVQAEDGLDGLQKFNDYEVSLIISDQEMPHLSGLELRRELGAELAVPFVLLSGYATEEEFDDDVSALQMVDAYLTKPVASRSLNDVLEQLLVVSS